VDSEAIMALPRRRDPRPDLDWRSHYIVENRAEVEAYVAEHPTVAAILDEAPAEIRAVFKHAAPPRLALHCDPEVGDCWLFIGIPWADVGPSVLPLIDELDERWWLDRARATEATVVIDVEAL
jgi:hypothetical protein